MILLIPFARDYTVGRHVAGEVVSAVTEVDGFGFVALVDDDGGVASVRVEELGVGNLAVCDGAGGVADANGSWSYDT